MPLDEQLRKANGLANVTPVELQFERADADEVTILLRGQLKIDTSDQVRHVVEQALEQTHPRRLVIDCAHVDFIDSQALAFLLSMSRQCRNTGGELLLRNPQPMVRKLLELTKLEALFSIFYTSKVLPGDPHPPRVPIRQFSPPSTD